MLQAFFFLKNPNSHIQYKTEVYIKFKNEISTNRNHKFKQNTGLKCY